MAAYSGVPLGQDLISICLFGKVFGKWFGKWFGKVFEAVRIVCR